MCCVANVLLSQDEEESSLGEYAHAEDTTIPDVLLSLSHNVLLMCC
jgi:hypothetical protein